MTSSPSISTIATFGAIGAATGWATATAACAFGKGPPPTQPGFSWSVVLEAGWPWIQVGGAVLGAVVLGGGAMLLSGDDAANSVLQRMYRAGGQAALVSCVVGLLGIPMAWRGDGPVSGFARGFAGTMMPLAFPLAVVAMFDR
jgi:hypothetical protein